MKTCNEDFLKVLSQYQSIIHKVNLIYFKRTEDRKDNYQEIVYQLYKSFPSLKERSGIASWIYAIAINTSISKIRKEHRLVIVEELPDTSQQNESDDFELSMDIGLLMEALYRLDEVDRSIMLLYLEDMTYAEMAQIIGISSVNIGVKISRIKKRLKNYLINIGYEK